MVEQVTCKWFSIHVTTTRQQESQLSQITDTLVWTKFNCDFLLHSVLFSLIIHINIDLHIKKQKSNICFN